ncbi:MAG: tRNA (N(6)-L-threonylcarbamoyladenosine(37)-C(2))-methylthiotransferase MtaB [Treponemataceae bacterium]|nr:tRNA (N(6)-L-threonylcarbamoyladenosine(37)-C(2))-methylthiotransferase MtaB [Treponemataceae bacterium]
MWTVSFETLGCKLNQVETEAIAEAFQDAGFALVPWGKGADIQVLNTCTVTSKAEQKARRLIRKALRDYPQAVLLITGCYAQMEAAAIEQLQREDPLFVGRLFVIPGTRKDRLLSLPAYLADAGGSSEDLRHHLSVWFAQGKADGVPDPFAFHVRDFSFHSRPFLKIQEGCNNVCSFCRVRLARGRSQSLPASRVLEEIQELERRGFGEVVLTGVNLNQYHDEKYDLRGLLEYLLIHTHHMALRLSSTEPEGVSEAFAEVLQEPRIRPHFHLSVQSGSDAILAAMRRRYNRATVIQAVERLRRVKEDPFLACDIITGFPGESAEDFAATVDLVGSLEFAYVHAFPFSPRPGTEAARLPNRVPEREARQRTDALVGYSRRAKQAYLARWIGRTVKAVYEGKGSSRGGIHRALTENYLSLLLEDSPAVSHLYPGQAFYCRIEGQALPGTFPEQEAPPRSFSPLEQQADTQEPPSLSLSTEEDASFSAEDSVDGRGICVILE